MEIDEWRARAEHTEGRHDDALDALLATKAELGELSRLQVCATAFAVEGGDCVPTTAGRVLHGSQSGSSPTSGWGLCA